MGALRRYGRCSDAKWAAGLMKWAIRSYCAIVAAPHAQKCESQEADARVPSPRPSLPLLDPGTRVPVDRSEKTAA